MKKTIEANLVAMFWGVVYGEIMGYIGAALMGAPYSGHLALVIGIMGAVVAFIAVNGISLLEK